MSHHDGLLAKSASHGGELSLLAHTRHVMSAAEALARKLGFDPALARRGAALHDLGKAHPYFQRKLRERIRLVDQLAHRHELSSLGLLPAFPADQWDALIEMVVAHHKSIRHDGGERGILDLAENNDYWIEEHLQDWERWAPQAQRVLAELGIPSAPVSRQAAEAALGYALRYCQGKYRTPGWSAWRGLLMAADHFASALQHGTDAQIQGLFDEPNLSFFAGRTKALYPLSELPADQPQPHTLVVAPTGAGKTDYLFRRCRGRVLYTLPFQASINAMYHRVRAANTGGHVRLQHAMARLVEKRSVEEKLLQGLVGASVKVLTPHQLAAIAFGTPGYEAVLLDVRNCDVILDEIHTYAGQAQAMVLAIVDVLLTQDCRIHIGSATMPTALYDTLRARLGGPAAVAEVLLPAETLDSFDRHIVHKLAWDADAPESLTAQVDALLSDAFAAGEKVLVIHNTVVGAQLAYERLTARFPHVTHTLLLHSRFKRGDRAAREERLMGADFNAGAGPCLVVSTQVVEVSLDISFDRMITEAAPLDALVQRFGRVNRARTEATRGRLRPVHVSAPGPKTLPYDRAAVQASFAQLPDGEVLRERDLQACIDAVYPTVVPASIGTHVVWTDGRVTEIGELTNRSRSVLVEALDIETATCILAADRETYLTASWEARIQLEIPLSWRTIQYNKNRSSYCRLDDIGSAPFVVPQPVAEYERLGLVLVEPDNFL